MTDSLSVSIQQAANDNAKREIFIEAYKPFIAAVVSRICGKYKQFGIDEELSIGLMAFNEAIDKFDGRGSFLSFAKLVIKSRLYDYFRYLKRRGESESLFDEEGRESRGIINVSFDSELQKNQRLELCGEIESFKKELAVYNISLSDLAKASPKHGRKRKAVNDVIRYMQSDGKCMEYFKSSGNLPLKIIESTLKISRKLIEPYRKYIIASILIYSGGYSYLKEYIK